MLEYDPDHVFAVEVALLAQNLLRPRIVLAIEIAELVPENRPAGKRPSRLANVLLGVVPQPHAEPLQQVSGQLVVRQRLAVGVGVQPDQHRRVAGNVLQEWLEPAQGMAPQQLDVLSHQRRALDLGVAGGKVIVPEKSHLLQERMGRNNHPPQPPRPQ